MTLKELIYQEINRIQEHNLQELYAVIQRFAQIKAREPQIDPAKPRFLSRLKQIQIQGPVDFSANLDLYLNGEK